MTDIAAPSSDVKINRVTIYAALSTLVFIIVSYKLVDFSSSVIPASFIEPLKQSLILVAAGFFQISKNFFVPSRYRAEITDYDWSHNAIVASFVFALTIIGLQNIFGFLVGFASGASSGALIAAGLQGNQPAIAGVILQNVSAFVTLPILMMICTVFGWVNHRKQFARPLLFFVFSYGFLIVAEGLDLYLAAQSDTLFTMMNTNVSEMAKGKLLILPLLFLVCLLLGYGVRSGYRFVANRV